MKPAHRLAAVVAASTAVFFSSLVITSAPAAADYTTCGVHTHTSRTAYYGGWKEKVRIHYRNCGYRTAKLRPDVANLRDPSCKAVYAGGTGYWSFEYTYYDGLEGGLPFFRSLKYC